MGDGPWNAERLQLLQEVQRLRAYAIERRAALEEQHGRRDQPAAAHLGEQRLERRALLGRRLRRPRRRDGEGVSEGIGDARHGG